MTFLGCPEKYFSGTYFNKADRNSDGSGVYFEKVNFFKIAAY